MLDEISCAVETRAFKSTGRISIIPATMTLSTLLDHFGVSVSGAILLRLGAIRYRLSLPAFTSPNTI
jgi:hypothetical protein